jgi:hypothetical protein
MQRAAAVTATARLLKVSECTIRKRSHTHHAQMTVQLKHVRGLKTVVRCYQTFKLEWQLLQRSHYTLHAALHVERSSQRYSTATAATAATTAANTLKSEPTLLTVLPLRRY